MLTTSLVAPAEVEWSTAGKWRRRAAQPAAVLTGSASPPLPLYLKDAQGIPDAAGQALGIQ